MEQNPDLDNSRKQFEILKISSTVFCILTGGFSLIQNPILGIGLIIAGLMIFIDKDWGPILGMICTIFIIINSIITLAIAAIFSVDIINSFFSDDFLEILIFIRFIILILNIMTLMLLFLFRKASKDYWGKYYSETTPEKSLPKTAYGVCPRCKCPEVEFVDGVKYKCAKCGYIY
jgi:hypothetical protein